MKAFASRGLIVLMLAGLLFVSGCKNIVGPFPGGPGGAGTGLISQPPLGVISRSYGFTLTSNGAAGSNWTIISGTLPAGVTLSAAGLLTGTPTEIGRFNLVVEVTTGGQIVSGALTMDVADALAVGLSTLPNGFLNSSYSQSLVAIGGIPGYTWVLTTPGQDPPGLDITNAGPGNATYSGTPTGSGLFTFTIEITDTGNAAVAPVTVTGQLTVVIFGAPAAFVVLDGAPGSVQVVDITDPAFAALGPPITVGNSPREIAFSQDATRAFVTNNGSDSLSIIDTITLSVVGTVNLGAGAAPVGIAAPNNTTFVLTANQGSNTISIVDYVLQAVVGTVNIPIPNSAPTGLAVTLDGTLAFASLRDVDKVIVINIDPGLPDFHSILAVLDIKDEGSGNPVFQNLPSGLGFSPASSKLFVSNTVEDDMGNPKGVVTVVDVDQALLDFQVGIDIDVGFGPAAIGVGPNCNFIHVANTGGSTFSVVKFDIEKQVRQGSGSGNPRGFGFSPDGEQVFVTYSGGQVSVFDAATGAFQTSFAAANPQGIAVLPDPRFRVFPLLPDEMPRAGWQAEYSSRLCAAGGIAPYTFDENTDLSIDGLPPGLSMDDKGLVTGKATSASYPDFPELFTFTVDVADSSLATQTLTGDAKIQVCCIGFPALVYVANFGDNTVSVIDTRLMHSVFTTIDAGLGANPLGVALSPDSLTIYVSNFGSANVSIIDGFFDDGNNPAFNTVTGVINVGLGASGMATSSDGRYLYVANEDDNTISVVDLTIPAEISVVGAGLSPQGVVVIDTAGGHRAYVTNIFSDNVTVIDVTIDPATGNITGQAVSTIANVGQGPVGIAATLDESRLYVTNQFADTVQVINTSNNSLGATITVGNFPTGIVVADNSRAYVANQLEDTVSVIDIFNDVAIDTDPDTAGVNGIAVGNTPDFLSASSSGFFVYVTNFGSGDVSIILNGGPDDHTVFSSVSVGVKPEGIKRQFGR